MIRVAEVLGCAAVGGFIGFWTGVLTDSEGAMSISAGFSGMTGAVIGATAGVVTGVLVFT